MRSKVTSAHGQIRTPLSVCMWHVALSLTGEKESSLLLLVGEEATLLQVRKCKR